MVIVGNSALFHVGGDGGGCGTRSVRSSVMVTYILLLVYHFTERADAWVLLILFVYAA